MTMKRVQSIAAVCAASGLLAGCVNFTGERLSSNPNSPTQANITSSFTAVQAFQFANLNGDFTRVQSLYTQQMAGTGRQFISLDAPYANDEGQFGSWNNFYTGSGLIDIRKIEADARASNDKQYLGIAQVWEALVMSYVADLWGNAPYREALVSRTPALDPQRQIYSDLQAVLDSAITNLAGAGPGPGVVDRVYGGNTAQWIKSAHTLKARLYLHVAGVDNTAYASAATQAALGITSAADDFKTYQSTTVGEENQWFQFHLSRSTDISAGAFLVNLMKSRSDTRLTRYFGLSGDGTIKGAAPGEEGSDFSWLSDTRGDGGFAQPMITADENQLILAEANARAGSTAPALTALNAVRARYTLPPKVALTGTALLTAILEEKYVSLFQSPEVWEQYKRTCYPNFALVNGATSVPLRYIYGADERAANPNVPVPSVAGKRNPVNPVVTTSADGTACLGQR